MDQTRLRIAVLSVVLFVLNTYICLELFRIEYLEHMTSIEPLFIGLARYIRDNWRDLTWFPFWYNGLPYQNTYSPLLPMLVAGVSVVTGWSPALAYHATVAFGYCLGPVLLFWLCYRLSRSLAFSFFAGVFHSVVSPSAFLIAEVHRGFGSIFRPRRLQTLVLYGEGPHVLGITLLALAVLLIDIAIQKRRPHHYVMAALACAACVLTNWLAGAALCIAVAAYLVARTEFPARRRVLATAAIAVLAYAFAAPWIPPSTIATFQFNAQTIEGDFRQCARLLPYWVLAIAAAVAIVKLILTKVRASQTLQFAAYFTVITGVIVMSWEYWAKAVVPQPHRYYTEMELGIAVLLPFAFEPLLMRSSHTIRIAIACACILAAIPFAKGDRRFARSILHSIDITQRIEYKTARWLEQNMPNARVLLPGSIMYWLHVFGDTKQLGGADEQGTPNFLVRVAEYVITSSYGTGERDAEISLTWLDAFGVDAIGIGGPKSGEAFKPFKNPSKFDGILQELWRDGDDVIYRVPQARTSQAHAIHRSDLPPRSPIHGLDIDPIKQYVAALQDTSFPDVSLRWTSRHSAELRGDLRPEHIVSAQITYHPGWHATVNGKPAGVRGDALGQMVIEPGCDGPCGIELSYDGGIEMLLARVLCWLAMAGSVVWLVLGSLKKRRASTERLWREVLRRAR